MTAPKEVSKKKNDSEKEGDNNRRNSNQEVHISGNESCSQKHRDIKI
jgi:hypothetical protein